MRLTIVNTVPVIIIIIIIIIICSRNVNSSFNDMNINNVIIVWEQEVITLILGLSDITPKFWMFLLFVIADVYKQYFKQDL